MPINKLKRKGRSRASGESAGNFNRKLLAAAVSAAIVSAPATAQDTVEEVVVTGSRIARDGFTATSPLDVFDETSFTHAGVTSVDEFLKDIPAFTGSQLGGTTNNGNNGARMVDLRGLGIKRTLVLIDSRRQVGSFIGDASDVGAVDLNAIPEIMISRIEVQKDSASTVYGSDALSGVVNVILNDDFEGFKVQGSYGLGMDKGDADDYRVGALAGAGNDRGHITAAIQWSKQTEMLQGARSWAKDELYPLLQPDGTFEAFPSGSSNGRAIRLTNEQVDVIEAAGGPGTNNWVVDETTGEVRPLGVQDLYNFAPVNALVTPNERYSFGAKGHYDLLDASIAGDVEGYVEALYTKRTSHQRLAADASFQVDDFNGHPNDFVPANNPFNPFGDNCNNPWGLCGEQVRLNRRFDESGGRLFAQSAETFRIVGGIRGELDFNDITWDVSYTYAENEMLNETKFYHRFDRWETMVSPDLCSADPGCLEVTGGTGNWNPFGPYGTITPEQIAFLSIGSLKDNYVNTLESWQINITGNTENFIELQGGPIGWAIGYERREESAEFNPDEFAAQGLTTSGAQDPLEGSFFVNEVYGELLLPLLADQEFAKELTLEGSVRHSNYSTSAGSSTDFGVKARWAPIEQVSFRGTYSTGFRAPNIVELYGGNTGGFPLVEPLCELLDMRTDISDTIRANCLAGDAYTGEYGFEWQSLYTQLAPAPGSLKPEESDAYTVGVVITPDNLVEGLQVSVDYWNIKIDNLIDLTPFNDLYRACLDSPNFTGAACALFDDGNPFLDGFPGNATAALSNQGKLKTDGIDIGVNYYRPLSGELLPGFVTGLRANVLATWVNSREEIFPLTGRRETVGTAIDFGVFPEWRFNTSLGFEGANWSFAWETRYIDKTIDGRRPAELTNDAVAESVLYHDLVGSFTWRQFTVAIGINNLTDIDPPMFHSAFNANTEPAVYDVIGRRIFTTVSMQF